MNAVTAVDLVPAKIPTLYFIGVTTGQSSIQRVFPRWASELGLGDVRLQGVDLALHADASEYRRVVEFIRDDPMSRGALVTTHKLDLFEAANHLFDEVDGFAAMMAETSCISKRGQILRCHAKDPISSGLAINSFVPPGYWRRNPHAHAVLLGAGGSTIAISWHLAMTGAEDSRPRRVTVTNRSQRRLDHIQQIHRTWKTPTEFEYALCPRPRDNDEVVLSAPAGSLVVNATGLGKDAPGSPLSDEVEFPLDAIVWDLNYRGDLRFLQQARAMQEDRSLLVEDGWVYFLHGWTQVIAEVFDSPIPSSGPFFNRLGELAMQP